MLKKSFGKRAASGIITAAMLASTAAATLPGVALTASAAGAQMLGQTNFDDGVGLPWHTCETQPAKLKFDISGGTYTVEIVNHGGSKVGGADRWDCQLRHRKLEFHSGCKYHVHAEVTSDEDGEIFAKISDLSGSTDIWHNAMGGTSEASYTGVEGINQSWDCLPVKAGETLIIDAEFECSQDLDVAEWAFHFGGAGEYQKKDCFPDGTHLKFDNMSLENLTNDKGAWIEPEKAKEYAVHGNQVGYYPNLEKRATVHDANASTVYILDAKSGAEVWKGTPSSAKSDEESGMKTQVIDFSEFKDEGTYYFSLDGKTQDSYPFSISKNVYNEYDTTRNGSSIVANALNYFYQNRAGVPIEEKYITSMGHNDSKAPLAHSKYGHNPDTAYLQNTWVKAYKNDGSDVQKSNGDITANDGWYDAGDHGKYVVNGGIAVWTLQNLYEWTLKDLNNSSADKFGDSSKSMSVPEAGNKIADILDETKVELEFFKEMMVPSSYKLKEYPPADSKDLGGTDTGKYENMVFHKLHDSKWTGLAVHAWDYQDNKDWKGITRIVKPPSTAATLNAAACFAQGARLFEKEDASYAKELLELAKKTYEAAKANPELYAPLDQAIGGGAYGDNEVKDDFYWAATELYITTGDSEYLTDLEGYSDAYGMTTDLAGGENHGTFTSFNWGNTAGLGTLSMYLNQDKFPEKISTITSAITKCADDYVKQEESEGFGVPYKGSEFEDPINIGPGIKVKGYEWGSNSMVINNAIVMAYAYSATGEKKYLNGASEACDYIFGRNAMDLSYITGYGTYHCYNPHHRYWSHELDKEFPYAPSGVMSGGPNAGMQDPYVAGKGYIRGKVPSQLCYVDSIEAWSVNEVTINWNSPFAWVMSFLEDEANTTWTPNGASVSTGTTSASTTGSTEGETTGTTSKTTSGGDDTASWGDANCSGESDNSKRVTVADAILVARVKAEDTKAKITDQGKANADLNGNDGIDDEDLTILLQYLAGLVKFGATKTAS
ncbi:MAG: glycoside hydrolase family 9 protein [Oscillospiraceae bacterium]|nr:glycoside hydrolase family 9 protein [Oscillospiraceae bacterium]